MGRLFRGENDSNGTSPPLIVKFQTSLLDCDEKKQKP